MDFNGLLRVSDIEPPSVGLPSFCDNLNQNSSERRVWNVGDALTTGLHIHFQFLVFPYRALFDKFHVHAGVLNRNTLLAARHFNGDARLHVARGSGSLWFGRRRRRILSWRSMGNQRTCQETNARKMLRRESHRSMSSIVYGTAGQVKSPHSRLDAAYSDGAAPAILRGGNQAPRPFD